MGYYLIDFENVHDIGLNGVAALTEKDEICIFYSEKSEHMSFETHVNIMKTPATVKYIKLRKSARNYLDFQLVTHLGYLVGSNAPGPYYIISKDTGYESAIDYWRDHGVNIIRQPSISYSSRQGRFPGQQNGQVTPAAIVTVQESHQVISENTPATLALIPENAGIIKKPTEPDREPETPAIPSSDQNVSAEPEGQIPDAMPSENVPEEIRPELITEEAEPQEEQPAASCESSADPDPLTKMPSEQADDNKADDNKADDMKADDNKAEEPKPRKNQKRRTNQKKQNNARSKKSSEESVSEASESAAPSAAITPSAEDSPAPAEPVTNNTEQAHPLEFNEEQAQATAESLPEAYRKKVRTALRGKEIPSAHYAAIYKAILHSYDKLALNNLMVKTFGSSKGGIVYNQIKDIFTDYHHQG